MNSLCSSCRHDIIYGKINFRVPIPPPHFRTIWDWMPTPALFSILHINWQYAFESKTINEKIQTVFSEVLMNILGNFVPHKLLKFNYKQPPWMNPKISSLKKRATLNCFTKIRFIKKNFLWVNLLNVPIWLSQRKKTISKRWLKY